MKYKKSIHFLVFFITLFSIVVTSYSLLSSQQGGGSEYNYQSVFGETVTLYGKGLYQHDSVSMAAQAIAQDIVTLIVGIPLLVISLLMARRHLLKGRLLLTGTLGYFLYTYSSYSFLSMYNSMFIIYVILMSASFFAFVLMMMSFEIQSLPHLFHEKLPVKLIGGFLIAVSFVFGMMWIGKIIPALVNHTHPDGIEHYTTLVIQALDLGFVIPTGFLAGILLIKRNPLGYLLAAIMTLKELTLVTALTAMIILQIQAGISINSVVIILIILINCLILYITFLLMKNVIEGSGTTR
jgi:hypothetical protein